MMHHPQPWWFETRIEQAESVYKDLPRFRARRDALKKALGK